MQQDNQDQEIDLTIISKKIGNFVDSIGVSIFKGIKFLRKNIAIIIGLFVIGAVLGYFLDRSNNSYKNEIIVVPNFGSVEDSYSKIALLQAKIGEGDSIFLKEIGLSDTKKIQLIEIEPIIDLYNFVQKNTTSDANAQSSQNFETIKLLAEDGDIKKVIKDEVTSKNYRYHKIVIYSNGMLLDKQHVQPILKYLNQSDYFQDMKKTYLENVAIKMKENQVIINQIDAILNQFSGTNGGQKSSSSVYYNEKNPLNEIILTKNNLIAEIGSQRVQLIDYQSVVKPESIVLNQKNNKGLNGKMSKVLAILFVGIFLGISFLIMLYKKSKSKYA